MIIRQAQTGQPVWIKASRKWVHKGELVKSLGGGVWIVKTNRPDWGIPNAEYSFKEFDERLPRMQGATNPLPVEY